MLYRANYAYPASLPSGVIGYGLYLEAPDLETATAKAMARCSAAASLESIALAAPRFQK